MRILVRAQPRARRAMVGGAAPDGALRVAVTEPAADGRATEAVQSAVAQAFGLPRRSVRLVQGAAARSKVLVLDGDEAVLAARMKELLA